jgi:hypothetical protein
VFQQGELIGDLVLLDESEDDLVNRHGALLGCVMGPNQGWRKSAYSCMEMQGEGHRKGLEKKPVDNTLHE